jgi:cytochrome b
VNEPLISNTPPTVTVWDPLVRLFHWLLVAAFATAYLTEDEWQTIHVLAGYVVCGLLAVRLIWGFIGTPHARFTDFVYSPGFTLRYLRDVLRGRATRYLGHNPAGGAMIIALLLALLVTVVSGLLLYGAAEWAGPLAGLLHDVSDEQTEWLEEIHEWSANFTLVLVGLHVAGVLWESILHRENLVLAMFTGRKRP